MTFIRALYQEDNLNLILLTFSVRFNFVYPLRTIETSSCFNEIQQRPKKQH